MEYTVANEVVKTPQGQVVIGYTDLPSRLSQQSSTLYSNNISKFLLSMGPFTTGARSSGARLAAGHGRLQQLRAALGPGAGFRASSALGGGCEGRVGGPEATVGGLARRMLHGVPARS